MNCFNNCGNNNEHEILQRRKLVAMCRNSERGDVSGVNGRGNDPSLHNFRV